MQTVFLVFNLFFLIAVYIFFPFKDLLSSHFSNLTFDFQDKGYIPLCGLLTFLSIFFFKKRKKQLLINNFQITIHVIYFMIFLGYSFASESYNYLAHLIIPIVSIIVIFFANRYIKKDEALIKSIDRIR